MENHPIPTFFQIISTDYLAQNPFIIIFGPWAIYFIDTLIEHYSSILAIGFAAFCTPIGLFFFLRRQSAIPSTFAHGQDIMDRVVSIAKVSRNGFLLEYEYDFDGQTHLANNHINPIDFARSLQNGQSVNMMVNAQNLTFAFLKICTSFTHK